MKHMNDMLLLHLPVLKRQWLTEKIPHAFPQDHLRVYAASLALHMVPVPCSNMEYTADERSRKMAKKRQNL